MIVVVKRPGAGPKVETIAGPRVLDDLQAIVGGCIEIAMRLDDIVWYCNEEGLLRGLPLNVFRPSDGHPIAGPIVAVKLDELGEDVSMTVEEAAKVQALTASFPIAPLPSYTCPRCGITSYNPNDLTRRYCGRCHAFEA